MSKLELTAGTSSGISLLIITVLLVNTICKMNQLNFPLKSFTGGANRRF